MIQKHFITNFEKTTSLLNQSTCDCFDVENYAPHPDFPEHTPLQQVRVNFHFIDHPEKQINFDKKLGKIYVNKLLKVANDLLSDNHQMFLPKGNNTPVLPLQFRYQLTGNNGDDGIYFHKDERLCYYNKNHKSKDFSLFSDDQFDKYGIRKGEVLNVFMLEHHPDSLKSTTYSNKINGVGKRKWAKMANSYWKLMNTNKGDTTDLEKKITIVAKLFNHEIGHSLGLAHTWRTNDGCDDTPKNNNCWYWDKNSPKCDEKAELSNNVMDYNAYQNAYSPCQIGKIHRNFHKNTSTQSKIISPIWCDYDEDKTITISQNTNITWCDKKRLQGDIVIEDEATLTVNCSVSLSQNAKISIHPKGKLILNGKLYNACEQKWQGIEVWSKGKDMGQVVLGDGGEVLDNLN